MKLTTEVIPHLARGAAVFGAGGGGDPYIGTLLARRAIEEFGDVELVELRELPDDALVLMVAMMGAPTVIVEKLPGLPELVLPITALEARLGRKVTHIVSGEIGGVNSLVPVAAAAATGLPLLDADCIGRAFPELQMALPNVFGVDACPVSFADERGNGGLIDAVDAAWAERLARAICVEVGSSMVFAAYPMSGRVARDVLVENSLRRCISVGEITSAGAHAASDPVAAVFHQIGGLPLLRGKVQDVDRATTAGFARGRATVSDGRRSIELHFQNEFLLATEHGESLVTSPDIIAVLDDDTGLALTTEALRYGQRVCVIAAPSDERWHSAAGLSIAGPAAFGYDALPRRFDGASELELSAAPALTYH